MLAGAGLGDDPSLAEPAREDGLPESVVQLVRSGVEKVLALQIQTLSGGESLRPGQCCRPAGERSAELVQLYAERRVGLGVVPAGLELVERGNERLRDVTPAVGSIEPCDGAHRAASTKALTFT